VGALHLSPFWGFSSPLILQDADTGIETDRHCVRLIRYSNKKFRILSPKSGYMDVRQNKAGKKLKILFDGTELEAVITRIMQRQTKVKSFYLVQTQNRRPLRVKALTVRFDKARKEAAENNKELAKKIMRF